MRHLDAPLQAEFQKGELLPIFLAELQFKTSTQRVWSGVGNLSWGDRTWVGVGSFAEIGTIVEGTDTQAQGTFVKLSGIDPVLLQESLEDVQPGLTAAIYIGAVDKSMNVIGTFPLFIGIIDKPQVEPGTDTISITLNLESRLIDFARASNRKYTSADQRAVYPHDNGFDFVEPLNNMALKPWK